MDVSAQVKFTKCGGPQFTELDISKGSRDLSRAGNNAFADCSGEELRMIAGALVELADEADKKHAIIKEAL